MRKAYRILLVAIGASLGGGLYLYDRYVGFAESPLELRVPDSAYAYFSIKHLRHAAFATRGDPQLEAVAQVFQAVALSLLASLEIDATEPDAPNIDPALWTAFVPHFKTQLSLALLPGESPDSPHPDILLLTNFYGDPQAFENKLETLARAASNEEKSYQWERRTWKNHTLRHLSLFLARETAVGTSAPPVSINWSIVDDILYVASNSAALESALDRHTSLSKAQSLASDRALDELPNFIERSDAILQIRAPQTLELLARLNADYQMRNPSYFSAVSLPKLFQNLGLSDTKSLTLAASFGEERELYLGVRLNERRGLWQTLHAGDFGRAQTYPSLAIQSSDVVAVDAGEALRVAKDALLGSAPIAALPYFLYQNKLLAETGLQLDPVLKNGFDRHLYLLQTLDVGTRRTPYGAIQEAVTHDLSCVLPLLEKQQVTRLLDSELAKLRSFYPDTASYDEIEGKRVFVLRGDPDKKVTSGRLAVYYDSGRVVVGYGTLRCFQLQLQNETREKRSVEPPPILAGEGLLSLDNLPSELSRLATVFFRQNNPQMDLPPEFLIFDWDSLSALELQRSSALFDLGDEHIYWHSLQL